jgi:deoxyadenosine/deoxycytidine kinase
MVGNPAAGKTYLAEILAKELDAKIIYEHPKGGFPPEIGNNLKNQENLLDTILWFRNHQIKNFLQAKELSKNQTIILDTPFYQNQLFIELYINDKFKKELLYEMGKLDFELLGKPDLTIYIETTTDLVKDFLNKRYGARHWENDDWLQFISQMPPYVIEFMSENRNKLGNIIELNRGEYDFEKKEDKERLFDLLMKNMET